MNLRHTEFEDLMAAVLEGAASAEDLARLRELMSVEPAFVAEYREQLQAHALLQWRSGGVVAENVVPTALSPAKRNRNPAWVAVAAAMAIGAIFLWKNEPAHSPASPKADTVWLEVLEAARSGTDEPFELATGARLSLSELQMPPGFFRFRLESGATVAVTGPADLRFVTPMHLRVIHGKVTADVGENAKGFIVETEQTRVVDLGTRFGVEVTEAGHTDVVVFQGEVELHDSKKESSVNRLVEGEAVRVNFDQQVSRISSITSGPEGDDEWSSSGSPDSESVITAVFDNLHNPKSNFYYRILRGGMREDARAFIAKRHEWNGIDGGGMPLWLHGADLVQTYGAGAKNENLELTVDVAVPAVVYLFVDSRVAAPQWLMRDFTDTGATIGLENAPLPESGIPIRKGPGNGNLAPFVIWKKEVAVPGKVILGPPPAAPVDRPHWMYGIAATRL